MDWSIKAYGFYVYPRANDTVLGGTAEWNVEDEAVPVLVAIVPDGIAFLAETPPGASVYDVLEVGRVPRSNLTGVDVVDAAGKHVPEPLHESFEPDVDVSIVLRWTDDVAPRHVIVPGITARARVSV